MSIKEAISILNEYRNRNYNSANKDEVELATAIDKIMVEYIQNKKEKGVSI